MTTMPPDGNPWFAPANECEEHHFASQGSSAHHPSPAQQPPAQQGQSGWPSDGAFHTPLAGDGQSTAGGWEAPGGQAQHQAQQQYGQQQYVQQQYGQQQYAQEQYAQQQYPPQGHGAQGSGPSPAAPQAGQEQLAYRAAPQHPTVQQPPPQGGSGYQAPEPAQPRVPQQRTGAVSWGDGGQAWGYDGRYGHQAPQEQQTPQRQQERQPGEGQPAPQRQPSPAYVQQSQQHQTPGYTRQQQPPQQPFPEQHPRPQQAYVAGQYGTEQHGTGQPAAGQYATGQYATAPASTTGASPAQQYGTVQQHSTQYGTGEYGTGTGHAAAQPTAQPHPYSPAHPQISGQPPQQQPQTTGQFQPQAQQQAQHQPQTARSALATHPAWSALHPQDAALLRRSLEELAPVAGEATAYFYSLLFVRNPELRSLFPLAMDAQRDRLFRALLTAASFAEDPVRFTEFLGDLGRGHRKYGTRPDQYPVFGECLLAAVSQYTPGSWDAATQAAWVRAYTAISQTMIDAAAEEAWRAPAWWRAEVVHHQQRTLDVAEVTVRPERGYPFRAGQYAPVETPWWPRVWRHYSFAAAQRGDGLLTFHVKAVPGGWVSTSLVRRARAGDVLRLGAPAGTMTVDHRDGTGLLCLGGGTGIAPIRAMIEELALHGGRRPVEVFYGARNRDDLYDLAELRSWEQRLGWLAVRPVVAASSGPTGVLPGLLPDAVRQFGPWQAFDGYLSGPPGLIRTGAEALRWSGIPQARIRHDAVAELTGNR